MTTAQFVLVGIFTQAILYGIYLTTLIQCFRWLIFTDKGWKLRKKINYLMTFATIFIFLMSTINLATVLKYDFEEYFRKDVSWFKYGTVLVMIISEGLAIIAIDGILIYRCWVVYAKSWRVICVPATFWLASVACATLFSYYYSWNYKGQTYNLEFAQISTKAVTAFYTCNIAVTIYTTTAIIYRIWSTTKNSGGNPKRLNYVVRILAESGILYTSMIIFRLVGVLLAARSDGTWVESVISEVSDVTNFSIGGISFNLILIRVYQSRVEYESKDVYEERTLPVAQLGKTPITPSSDGPSYSSNVLDDTVDEIQEKYGSHGGIRDLVSESDATTRVSSIY